MPISSLRGDFFWNQKTRSAAKNALRVASIHPDEVTHATLFYWRQEIRSALKQIPTEAFQVIVQMDETYFLYSEKGKRNIAKRKPRKRGGKAHFLRDKPSIIHSIKRTQI